MRERRRQPTWGPLAAFVAIVALASTVFSLFLLVATSEHPIVIAIQHTSLAAFPWLGVFAATRHRLDLLSLSWFLTALDMYWMDLGWGTPLIFVGLSLAVVLAMLAGRERT